MTFFVKTPAEQIGGAYQGDQFGQKRVNSYVQLLGSQRLADLVIDETQLDITAAQLTSEISAKGDLNTVLLTATVTDTSPARSLLITQSISKQFVDLVASLETAPGSSTPTVTLEVTSTAALDPQSVSPRPLLNLGLSFLVGLVLGAGLAILRELLDTTVRSVEGLKQLTGSAVLVAIGFDETAKSSPLITGSHARSVRAEAYRQLRTNLQFVDVDSPLRVLIVTSSIATEGKSCTAANLAVSFAEAGKRVLLMEGDLRRPRVAEYLGLEGSVGLTNVLAGQVSIDDVLQEWGDGGLTVLPSGSIPPNPSELLGSQNMADLLSSLKSVFDLIVIDTPPLLPVTDAAVLATQSDGVILVVRHGKTTKVQISRSVDALRAVDARLFGSVLNMIPLKGADSHGYQYGYGYYEDSPTSARAKLGEEKVQQDPRPVSPNYFSDQVASSRQN